MIAEAIELSKLMRKNERVENEGADAAYGRLNDKWGVKLYYDKSTRDVAWERQAKAAGKGLGPRVGDIFDLPDGDAFCYITENVSELLMNSPLAKRYRDNEELQDEFEYYDDYIAYLLTNLSQKLGRLGIPFYDLHDENAGFLDGKLVCIDFAEGT